MKTTRSDNPGDNPSDKRSVCHIGVKFRKNAAIACMLILMLVIFTIITYAAEPGSTADPIALKSYVDSKLDALETKLTAMLQNNPQTGEAADNSTLATKISELESAIERLKDENEALRQSIRQTPSTGSVGSNPVSSANQGNNADYFTAVEIAASRRIIFGAGAEMVLRTGKASAIRGELGALVDLITGSDLDAGENVPINHLILSPRDDNRGVRISEDSWILIKGLYELR